jgi:hypothetical protein
MEDEMAKALDVNENTTQRPESKPRDTSDQQKKPQGKSLRVNENTVEEKEPSSAAPPKRPPQG